MNNSDIAIDFGSATFRIAVADKGVVVNEPAFMAVDNKDDVIGVGREAYVMVGRTTNNITVDHPFSIGYISNYPMAEHMTVKYIKRVAAGKLFLPGAVVSVPLEINEVQRHAFIDIIEEAGIRKINFVFEPFAASIGAGLDIFGSRGVMVVDIGATKTTASVISAGRIHTSSTIGIGGFDFDDGIIDYIRKKYELEIGRLSAEELKIQIGSAMPREKLMYCHVMGKDIHTDLPRDITVTSDDMVAAFAKFTEKISVFVQEILADLTVSICGDIAADGIMLVGGTAKLYGIDKALERRTDMRFIIPENPENAVITGAEKAIKLVNKTMAKTIFL